MWDIWSYMKWKTQKFLSQMRGISSDLNPCQQKVLSEPRWLTQRGHREYIDASFRAEARRDLQDASKKNGRSWETGKAFDFAAACSSIRPAHLVTQPWLVEFH